MLGVSLSSVDGLCPVATKYVVKIDEPSSFGFCNDDILVNLYLFYVLLNWIDTFLQVLFIIKSYETVPTLLKINTNPITFFLREKSKNAAGITHHPCLPWPCVDAADE